MKKLLFVITQFYKGGAEVALLNLFRKLTPKEYEVDFLIFDQMIIKGAQSLIPDIPDWIQVCNAAESEGHFAVVKKIYFKIHRKITKHQLYRKSAHDFVNKKNYDVAFSYGEWMSPEFVAKQVNAKKKYIWIHADIDKAKYVDEKILFGNNDAYNGYIFVSDQSKADAELKYPMLRKRSFVIHNMCDDKKIWELGQESLDEIKYSHHKWLLSVANLREEKNYPRMIETMKILKARGIDLKWLCIGSTANPFILKRVETLLSKYQLEDNFILLGTKNNPYNYMKRSEAVIVLSDFEAWSLVITEAKLLGVPVISTKTSGAIEQIQDKKTGILVSFNPIDIADTISGFLIDPLVRNEIHHNLKDFSTSEKTLDEFKELIGE
mgnify:CR=1 FL=1|jgi:glycosyltransferase involved in cell wall biosynthesis